MCCSCFTLLSDTELLFRNFNIFCNICQGVSGYIALKVYLIGSAEPLALNKI